MEKRIKFNTLLSGVGKAAKDAFDNVVHVADQNDDGKFDLSDVSIIAETVGNTVKKGTQTLKDNVDEKAKLIELKTLQPVFSDDLSDANFLISKFVRVAERDKKYIESSICQGSIGYISNQNGLRIVNVFRDSIEAFGLTFYPDCEGEFYYIDPSDRDRYIALDEYFSYLKVARINELQKIAQDLGAKHFRVTYKEEKTSFSDKKVKGNVKSAVKGDVECDFIEKKYSTIEIAAEMEFPAHLPMKPTLRYLQRDPSIQTLISMRMNESAPLLHQKYMLKLSNSTGMKESDAIKIDAVLKELKCSGNVTVASEARNESRRYLEYDIEF